jgi:hypothetical protein
MNVQEVTLRRDWIACHRCLTTIEGTAGALEIQREKQMTRMPFAFFLATDAEAMMYYAERSVGI